MKGGSMATMNELSGGEPADRAALDAIIREVGDPHPVADGWATIREWGAANLSPAVLAETQAAVRDELRTCSELRTNRRIPRRAVWNPRMKNGGASQDTAADIPAGG